MSGSTDGVDSTGVTGSSMAGPPNESAENNAVDRRRPLVATGTAIAGGVDPPLLIMIEWLDPTSLVTVFSDFYIIEVDGSVLRLAASSVSEARLQFDSYLKELAKISWLSRPKNLPKRSRRVRGVLLLRVWRGRQLSMRRHIYTDDGQYLGAKILVADEAGRLYEEFLPAESVADEPSAETCQAKAPVAPKERNIWQP